jgi:hypothetical protein
MLRHCRRLGRSDIRIQSTMGALSRTGARGDGDAALVGGAVRYILATESDLGYGRLHPQ